MRRVGEMLVNGSTKPNTEEWSAGSNIPTAVHQHQCEQHGRRVAQGEGNAGIMEIDC